MIRYENIRLGGVRKKIVPGKKSKLAEEKSW